MEERNTYDKQYEIIISFNKIWDNLVRYWWICIVCFAIAILAVFFLSYRSYVSGEKLLQDEFDIYQEDIDLMVENEEDKLKYVYTAKSIVYMARDNADLSEITGSMQIPDEAYLEQRSDYIEIYKEYMNAWLETTYMSIDKNLLYDCLALMYTDSVTDEINKQLTEAGYDEYDRHYEKINMSLSSNARFYTLSLTGEESERIEFIIDIATEILIDKTKDILGIEYSKIVDKARAREYIEWENQFYLATDKVIEEYDILLQEKIEERMTGYVDVVERINNYNFSLSNIISVKNILVLFVGIFLGLGIIFVLILLDKKIRNRDEAEMYFEYPVLGDVNLKINDDAQYSVVAAALERRCTNEGIQSILITGSDNGNRSKAFAGRLTDELKKLGKASTLIDINITDSNIETKINSAKKKDGLLIISSVDINKSSSAIQAVGYVDSILYIVCANNESIPLIQKGINNIKIAGGNILGSLLIKNSRIFK